MAKEIQFPTGHKMLDDFMANIVWRKFPKVRLFDKRSSVLMWFAYVIFFMWIWNRKFIDRFNTVVGHNVYIVRSRIERKEWASVYRTMRHELIHLFQKSKYWILFDILYTFPQCIAFFAILSLLAIWFSYAWLYALLSLVVLLPIPSPWRTMWELEGYAQTMLVYYEDTGQIPSSLIDNISKNFTGPSYYFMCPFRSYITRKINDIAVEIRSGKLRGFSLHY